MRLQDQEDFKTWLEDRKAHSREIGAETDTDRSECAGCGTSADEQTIVEGECMACLAFDFGIHTANVRMARVAQEVVTTLKAGDERASLILVQHITDRMEDALAGFASERPK